MADYGFDGMVKVAFLATPPVSYDAPTVAELTAGVPLDGRLTPDGLDTAAATASIDTSKLNSTANSATIGRDTYTVSVKYVRGDDTEATTVQDALIRGAAGTLAVRRDKLASVDWAAADDVELYPIICQRPNPDKPAPNALQAVTVGMEITDGTKVRSVDNPATVAAGA